MSLHSEVQFYKKGIHEKKSWSCYFWVIDRRVYYRLEADALLDDIKTGKFVTIAGRQYLFFALITDLALEVTNSDILRFPPTEQETLLQEILGQESIYATAQVKPLLMLDKNHNHCPVKTIPHHLAQVMHANKSDIAHIFGSEDDESKKYFQCLQPLDRPENIKSL